MGVGFDHLPLARAARNFAPAENFLGAILEKLEHERFFLCHIVALMELLTRMLIATRRLAIGNFAVIAATCRQDEFRRNSF